ncbi:hypothetical protein GF324_13365 [bacterium]|nr:hypothetical protein [bacterium]
MTGETEPAPGNRGKRLPDYFFVLRPTLWFPVWTMILAGAGGVALPGVNALPDIAAITGLSILWGWVYLVNQIADIQTDRVNDKLFYFAEGWFSRREGIAYSIALFVVGTVLLLLSEKWTLFALTLGVLMFSGILYSIIPGAWKNHPFGSVVATLLGGALCFLIGRALAGRPLFDSPLQTAGYAAAFLAAGLLTMVPDMKGDREAGKRTFAVVYGVRSTAWTAVLLLMGAVLASLASGDMVLLSASVVSLPFYLAGAARLNASAVAFAARFSILLLSLSVGLLLYPGYLAIIGIYYLLARVYYHKRFGLRYPTLTGR